MLVNTFVVTTTQFLNHFSALAEDKLASVSRDVSRLEKVLLLLETKIYRPDAEETQAEVRPALTASAAAPSAGSTVPSSAGAEPVSAAAAAPTQSSADIPSMPAPPAPVVVEVDPRFEKFLTMKKLGIPRGAIEHGMAAAGIDSTGFPWD